MKLFFPGNLCRRCLRKCLQRFSFLKALFFDLLLGIETRREADKRNGIHVNKVKDTSLHRDMVIYEGTEYGSLKRIIAYLRLTPGDVFVDLGCGKGRAVFIAARKRLKKVVGVEIDEMLATVAIENHKRLRGARTPVVIIHADAAGYAFTDENVIFLFNPFGSRTMETVLRNIRESLNTFPRRLRIAYYNPQHKYLLDSQDWLRLEAKLERGELIVYSSR